MANTHGNLSINSTNIFPIIKKWLYSDHDIFVRELVSNGCDAITKLKKLEIMGEYTLPSDNEWKITVKVNQEDKTIKFIDTGLGMTAEEVNEYINQIAFSGATDFIEKYKDKTSEDQIIGHFGLGFYSAFMVSDKVTIDTLSYKEDAVPVHWECDGGTEFDMSDGHKETRGTEITLYLNEDCYEFSNEYRIREILDKYCSFMPTEIYLVNENAAPEYETIDEDKVTDKDTVIEHVVLPDETEEVENDEGEKVTVIKKKGGNKAKILKRIAPINDTNPLWFKHPNDCTKEEYVELYQKVFRDFKEPLFYIHLNMDYPFNLKGILYFPKLNLEYESIEGKIKLYNNQVFIADNIKEVIPDFLLLLKGIIDCPDLPLNVSRSALQNDGFVKKISDYISKKVADKLIGMYKTEKESYEKYWDDINPFIKFGCLKDDTFCDKMKDFIIYKNLEGKYLTLNEYLENNKEKCENTVYYITNEDEQSQYINMWKENGMDAVYLTASIDQPFITHLEEKNKETKFMRIDSDVSSILKDDSSDEDLTEISKTLDEVFKKNLNGENVTISVEKLKNSEISAMITLSEESRRMQDMMKMYAMPGMDVASFAPPKTLVLNANNELVKYILEHKDSEDISLFCEQVYDLALISHAPLSSERMTNFIKRSNDIMLKLAK